MSIITGVIPVHNHEKWVCDSINSMAQQDLDKGDTLRIIVVNDGSTDQSHEAVMSMLENSVKPKVQNEPWVCKGIWKRSNVELMYCKFEKANGPAFARNWGIQTGWDGSDVFALLDSDDTYSPNKIKKSVEIWKANPNGVGIVYSDFTTFNEDGLRLRQYKEPFCRNRLLQECLINCDSIVSKQAFEECGLFDDSLRVCEDYDLYMRVTEKFVAVHIPESLINIRVGRHSSSSSVPNQKWQENYRKVFEKLKQRMSQNGSSI